MNTRTLARGAAAATLLLTTSLSAATVAAGPDETTLIDREILFGNPERVGVQISPDGSRISFVAPLDGVMNVWVAPADDPGAAQAITRDNDRGIRRHFWMPNGTHIVYLQDRGGDENWRAYSVNLESGAEIDLTPLEGVAAQVAHVSRDFPDVLAIGLNDRDSRHHDIHLVNALTGEREMIFENSRFASVTLDDAMRVRIAAAMNPDGSMSYFTVDGSEIADFQSIPFEDTMTTAYIGLDRAGERLFSVDSRGRNLSALTVTDLATGESKVLFTGERSDVADAMVNPIDSTVEAVATNYLKPEWTVLSPTIEKDIAYLRGIDDGELSVGGRSLDDTRWIVSFRRDDGPTDYYLHDRRAGTARKLFTSDTRLEGLPLVPMHGVEIATRDGLTMPSYLTLPQWSDPGETGRPSAALPMVLMVHGGPWARDSWGYNPYHQWLANRGYAVLSPNFRGSTGFGKSFVNAGDGEWADAMHNDLVDAVEWAVANGIAQRDRIAILGGSYGGYAALAGVTFTPEVFAASVAIVGPSNLITLLESIPPYWGPMIEIFTKRVGDHRTPEGRRRLRDMSPLTHVDEIVRPLLIGQGANDPRVKQPESDQIVKAMQAKSLPVTYVLFPDEGHGFAKPTNNIAFNAVTEAFLGTHLGGRVQPLGDELASSTALVLSKGGVELDADEVSWDELAALQAAPLVIEEVTFEELSPAQQNMVRQMLGQLEQVPAEMLPTILRDAHAQIEAGLRTASAEDRPMLMHLHGVVTKRVGSLAE